MGRRIDRNNRQNGSDERVPRHVYRFARSTGIPVEKLRWCRDPDCTVITYAADSYQQRRLDAIGFTRFCPDHLWREVPMKNDRPGRKGGAVVKSEQEADQLAANGNTPSPKSVTLSMPANPERGEAT